MKSLTILGLILFSLGALLLVGFGLYKFLTSSSLPWLIRWGMIGLFLGTITMLVSLVIERIKDSQGE